MPFHSIEVDTFLRGGDEMGGRIAAFDWSATDLGPIESWPSSLRAIIAFIVHCPVPLVMLWGEDGVMIYNDGYSRFAGDNHPRILGCPVREAWPEADFNGNVMHVGLAGGTLAYENHRLRLNRHGIFEDVWMNLDYSPVYDDFGEPAGVMAIVIETTEAVKADAALRESEARLQFLDILGKRTAASTRAGEILAITMRMVGEELGLSNCAYADMDEDQSGFTIRGDWAREGSLSIVGHYNLADFSMRGLRRLRAGLPLVINDILAELDPEEARAFQNAGIGATICVPLVKEGRLIALMVAHHARPHGWSAHELAMTCEIAQRSWAHIERAGIEEDLRRTTERLRDLNETLEMRVEERSAALTRSQTQFRLLVQGVTDYAIYMLDPGGLVSSWNAGAERIKGFAPEEIIGRHFSTFYTEEDRAQGEPQRALETARRDGRFAAEGWRLRKDGSRFRASVVVDVIHDDDGQLIGFTKITRDITEREETQRALDQAREALFQSQKLEAIGQLTGGVAHDFNNLLMAILSGLELLRKRIPDDPRIIKLIDNSAQAAERGAALTQRMLAFARRQELKVERVNIVQLVAGIRELLQRSLGATLTIETSFPTALPYVSADVNQLEMALLNLSVNARDAMGEEGKLTISAVERILLADEMRDLAPGHYVRLTLSDTGAGMDAETLDRATEPFFTTKGVGEGTGLGLSMIHGFARQSGGALQLESSPGQGTQAHIWLPVAAQTAPSSAPCVCDDPQGGDGAPLVILVVDDDAIVLMNTAALLEDLGHTVIEAGSAAEALQHLQGGRNIDLLITDQAMPIMTGSDLVANVRTQHPILPVILATGYGEIPLDHKANLYQLGKPFNQADLRRAIRKAAGA